MLLAIIGTLSVSFLQKAATGTAAVVSRGSAMKAHYMARSAANHALWRLLNDPAFSPPDDAYTMHDLAGGRYGYKVRKPTPATFGTVAAVGAVSESVSKQSVVQHLKPYNIITTYDRSSAAIPQHRRLIGAYWGDAADTVNDRPDAAHWMVLKGCPQPKEILMGTLDTGQDINFAVWNGTLWGNLYEFPENT